MSEALFWWSLKPYNIWGREQQPASSALNHTHTHTWGCNVCLYISQRVAICCSWDSLSLFLHKLSPKSAHMKPYKAYLKDNYGSLSGHMVKSVVPFMHRSICSRPKLGEKIRAQIKRIRACEKMNPDPDALLQNKPDPKSDVDTKLKFYSHRHFALNYWWSIKKNPRIFTNSYLLTFFF